MTVSVGEIEGDEDGARIGQPFFIIVTSSSFIICIMMLPSESII